MVAPAGPAPMPAISGVGIGSICVGTQSEGSGFLVRRSWRGSDSADFRTAFRDNYEPDFRGDDYGFRCAHDE